MPTITKRKQPDPDTIFVCAIPHAGPHGIVVFEEQRRGDDPAVRANLAYFVKQGTIRSEWPTPLDSVIESCNERERERERERDERARRNRVRLTRPQIVRATRDVRTTIEGKDGYVVKGSERLATDPLVLGDPDAWEGVK